MKRIAALLLITVFLFSACENISTTASIPTTIDEENASWPLGNLAIAPTQRREGIKALAAINEEDINWSGNRETRTIEINDYITINEFYEIKELVLGNGYIDVHGTLYGALPSYFFGSVQVFLIPRFGWWYEEIHGENKVIGLDFRVGWLEDSLRIHGYTVYRDADFLGNATDTLNNFTLVTHSTDTGITDEQILMQFISYLDEVRSNLAN